MIHIIQILGRSDGLKTMIRRNDNLKTYYFAMATMCFVSLMEFQGEELKGFSPVEVKQTDELELCAG